MLVLLVSGLHSSSEAVHSALLEASPILLKRKLYFYVGPQLLDPAALITWFTFCLLERGNGRRLFLHPSSTFTRLATTFQ